MTKIIIIFSFFITFVFLTVYGLINVGLIETLAVFDSLVSGIVSVGLVILFFGYLLSLAVASWQTSKINKQ